MILLAALILAGQDAVIRETLTPDAFATPKVAFGCTNPEKYDGYWVIDIEHTPSVRHIRVIGSDKIGKPDAFSEDFLLKDAVRTVEYEGDAQGKSGTWLVKASGSVAGKPVTVDLTLSYDAKKGAGARFTLSKDGVVRTESKCMRMPKLPPLSAAQALGAE